MKYKIEQLTGNNFQYFNVRNDKDEYIGWVGIEISDMPHYTFKEYCNEQPDRCAKIVYVKTNKSYRNQGVATEVLNKVVKEYEDWDLFLQVIPLDSNNTVQTLTKFYEKFGFKRCESGGSIPTMIKPAKL